MTSQSTRPKTPTNRRSGGGAKVYLGSGGVGAEACSGNGGGTGALSGSDDDGAGAFSDTMTVVVQRRWWDRDVFRQVPPPRQGC